VEAPGHSKQDAKSDQGVTVDRGINGLTLSQSR
jgi:hypothetical protein